DPARDDGALRAVQLLNPGRGEPAAALRADAQALARALRSERRPGRADVRPQLRARLAPVSRRLDRRIPDRLVAALPGGVRAAARQRHSALARAPLRLRRPLPARPARRAGHEPCPALRAFEPSPQEI